MNKIDNVKLNMIRRFFHTKHTDEQNQPVTFCRGTLSIIFTESVQAWEWHVPFAHVTMHRLLRHSNDISVPICLLPNSFKVVALLIYASVRARRYLTEVNNNNTFIVRPFMLRQGKLNTSMANAGLYVYVLSMYSEHYTTFINCCKTLYCNNRKITVFECLIPKNYTYARKPQDTIIFFTYRNTCVKCTHL